VTLQEPQNPPTADVDMPDTEVIVVAHPSPVFVDSTGRRRRMLRKVAYGFGALCMVYGGLVSVSLAGGPVSSSAVLPLPNLDDDEEDAVVARPSPTPEPVAKRTSTQPVLEVFPRQGAPVTRIREARAVPSRTPAPVATTRKPAAGPSKSPSKSTTPSKPKPVESTITDPPSSGPSPVVTGSSGPIPPGNPGVGGGQAGGDGTSGGGQAGGSGGSGGQAGGDSTSGGDTGAGSGGQSGGGQGSGGQGGGGSADEPDPVVPPKPPAVAEQVVARAEAVARPVIAEVAKIAEPVRARVAADEPDPEPEADPDPEPDDGDAP
jgi:hypothetical protein